MPEISTLIITAVFFIIMLVVFIKKAPERRKVNIIPTVIMTIGILGTFVGIFWGLLTFDVNNIALSVPKLLEGLKIAFITSIVGIVLALTIRLRNFWKTDKEEKRVVGATLDTLAEYINNIDTSLKKQNEPILDSLKSIENSLVGEGDTTIITQLQKIRTSLGDKLDSLKNELKEEFHDFVETMADNNSKALIQALEEVIKDFNAKINEQFGDNFKQLNEAVGKMLEWQEKYKEQMSFLIERFSEIGGSFDNIDKNLREISEQINTVLELVDEIDSFLTNAKVHLDALKASIDAHARMADKANEVFPIIENRINQLTKTFSDSVQSSIENNQKAVNRLQDAIEEQSAFVKEHTYQMGESAKKLVTELETTIDNVIKQNNNLISQQFNQISSSMEKELNKAIGTLGSQLASLSEKFVSDYTPLTNSLKDVVEIARDLNERT